MHQNPPLRLEKSGQTRWATVSKTRSHHLLRARERHSLFPHVAKIETFVQADHEIRPILLVQAREDQRQALLLAPPADADSRDAVAEHLREPEAEAEQDARLREQREVGSLLELHDAVPADHAEVVLVDDGGARPDDRLVDGLCQADCFAQAGGTVKIKFQLSASVL